MTQKTSRDTLATRSVEIPAIGTAICAEWSDDHLSMYDERNRAAFFAGADDNAEMCKALVRDPARRTSLAAVGHCRAPANRDFDAPLMHRLPTFARETAG